MIYKCFMKLIKLKKLLQILQLKIQKAGITVAIKQGSISGTEICCAKTAKVNDGGEKVGCNDGLNRNRNVNIHV